MSDGPEYHPADPDLHIEFGDCTTCHEGLPRDECPKSLRPCGHHCNHSWDQDKCHWCGVEFGEDGEETRPNVEAAVDACELG